MCLGNSTPEDTKCPPGLAARAFAKFFNGDGGVPQFFFTPGAREKALARTVFRCISEARVARCVEGFAKLSSSHILAELAQLAASGALVNLRKPGILYAASSVETVVPEAHAADLQRQALAGADVPMPEPDAEPDDEPDCEMTSLLTAPGTEIELCSGGDAEIGQVLAEDGQVVSYPAGYVFPIARIPAPPEAPASCSPYLAPPPTGAGAAGHVVPVLLDCVPCFRLGLPHAVLTELVGMREAPSFFTLGLREKPFEVSLKALSEHIVAQWLKNPELAAAILRPETCMAGVGCALDIGHDDKAIIIAVIA